MFPGALTPTLAAAAAAEARNDHSAAAELFGRAMQEDNRDLRGHRGLAWALLRSALRNPGAPTATQQLRLACDVLEHALALDEHDGTTVALLSLCLMNAGAPERGSQVMQRFLQRHPFDVAATGLLGDLIARPADGLALLGLEPAVAPPPAPKLVHRGPKLSRPSHAVATAATSEFLNVSYSQEGEDLVLLRIFCDDPVGVYVDVGAHHPLRFSNTHRLYLQGWRGVNVEPNPELAAVFERVRPGDINVACGVSDVAGSLTYFMFNEPALNSFDPELAKSREGGAYRIVETRTIDVLPLRDLLAQCLEPGTAVDLLSVDVEGLDLNVLRSNDWTKVRPRCVVAEALRSDVEAVLASELHAFMRGQGYRLFAKTFNSVFYLDHAFSLRA